MAERDRAKLSALESVTSVEQYVQRIAEEKGVTVAEAAKELCILREEGAVRLVDPDPPTSLRGYLLSLYSAWYWLLLVAIALMLSTIYVLPQVPPFSWARTVLGFVTSLYLPGYAFIEALYPQRTELEELERFALSVGLSLALTPLTGFVLNYTPWGIRLDPIAVSISLLTMALGVVAVYRKYQYHMLSLETLG